MCTYHFHRRALPPNNDDGGSPSRTSLLQFGQGVGLILIGLRAGEPIIRIPEQIGMALELILPAQIFVSFFCWYVSRN